MEKNTVVKKKFVVASVVEFSSIVTLQKMNGKRKMSVDITLKINKQAMHVRFVANGKGPYVVRIIIHEYKIIFETRHTRYRGSPEITMQQFKGKSTTGGRGAKRQPNMFA